LLTWGSEEETGRGIGKMGNKPPAREVEGKMSEKELAIITVMGKDRPGLVAGISRVLADHRVNIEDISQTILQDMFSMILIVDISSCDISFESLQESLNQEGRALGVKVLMQHKKIFDFMHRI
jgi:ACT domain-containing protein